MCKSIIIVSQCLKSVTIYTSVRSQSKVEVSVACIYEWYIYIVDMKYFTMMQLQARLDSDFMFFFFLFIFLFAFACHYNQYHSMKLLQNGQKCAFDQSNVPITVKMSKLDFPLLLLESKPTFALTFLKNLVRMLKQFSRFKINLVKQGSC